MTTCVALLRGINIGSRKRIAMADLRALVGDLGYANARTLVNSGNVVFDVDGDAGNREIENRIVTALRESQGLDVPVLVRTGDEMRAIVDRNPFPEMAPTPKLLHVTFLANEPEPARVETLQEIEGGDDDVRVIGTEVYLSSPNGLSGSVFNINGLDRLLGVVTTSRNWNTVSKLAAMATDG